MIAPMKKGMIAALLVVATAAGAGADERKFTADSVPKARLPKRGRVIISNDHRSITAWQFFGDVREALVSLRSTRVIATHAFGAAIYNSNAPAPAPRELAGLIEEASRTHGVDPRLVSAVARRESAWDVRAVSSAGACGVMQLMPETARYLGVRDIFDARENIFGGARYLRTLLDTFNGDLDLALAAYNAGPGAVAKYRGVPPYAETRAYVASIRAAYEKSLKSGA